MIRTWQWHLSFCGSTNKPSVIISLPPSPITGLLLSVLIYSAPTQTFQVCRDFWNKIFIEYIQGKTYIYDLYIDTLNDHFLLHVSYVSTYILYSMHQYQMLVLSCKNIWIYIYIYKNTYFNEFQNTAQCTSIWAVLIISRNKSPDESSSHWGFLCIS